MDLGGLSFKGNPLAFLFTHQQASFLLLDSPFAVPTDCSFRTEDGIIIIEWKTGRTTTSDVSLQLSCYAMYGKVEKWGLNLKKSGYNLLSDQRAGLTVTGGEIADTKSYIEGRIADMKSLLVDLESNIPKEERFFKKLEDDRIRDRCNFGKVCD